MPLTEEQKLAVRHVVLQSDTRNEIERAYAAVEAVLAMSKGAVFQVTEEAASKFMQDDDASSPFNTMAALQLFCLDNYLTSEPTNAAQRIAELEARDADTINLLVDARATIDLNYDLKKRIEALTKERDEARARVAELERALSECENYDSERNAELLEERDEALQAAQAEASERKSAHGRIAELERELEDIRVYRYIAAVERAANQELGAASAELAAQRDEARAAAMTPEAKAVIDAVSAYIDPTNPKYCIGMTGSALADAYLAYRSAQEKDNGE